MTVIHTPGHSPGHCCFYEQERKYLYSGDLIYSGCLDVFYPTTDPEAFFTVCQKKFQVFGDKKKLLPAHHQLNIPVNIINRIETGFSKLADEGKLKHGGGIFDFGDFQIHI